MEPEKETEILDHISACLALTHNHRYIGIANRMAQIETHLLDIQGLIEVPRGAPKSSPMC